MAKTDKGPKTLLVHHEPEMLIDRFKWHLHGLPKTGKTSLAMQFPGAVLLPFEHGFKSQRVEMYDVRNWDDTSDAIDEFCQSDFQTLVWDTIDRAIDWLYEAVCKDLGIEAINEKGFAEGYRIANRWLKDKFDQIDQSGKAFVLISHTRTVDDMEGAIAKATRRLVPDVSNSPRKVLNQVVDVQGYVYVEQDSGPKDERITRRYIQVAPTADCQSGGRINWLVTDVELTPTPREGFENLRKEFDEAIRRQLADLRKEEAPTKRRK